MKTRLPGHMALSAHSSRSGQLLGLAACAITVLLCLAPAAAAADLTLTDEGFHPASVEVAPGEDVVWVNDSLGERTIVGQDGSWDSGPLHPGETFSVSLRAEGRVAYGTVDGAHVGQLVVRAVPAAVDGQGDAAPTDPATLALPLTGQPGGRAALLAAALLAGGSALVLAASSTELLRRCSPRTG